MAAGEGIPTGGRTAAGESEGTGRSLSGKRAGQGGRGSRKPRGPDDSKLTEEALREAALSYLDRYDASAEQLRQVLLRRVLRYGEAATNGEIRERIEVLLRRFRAAQLLDDERFAKNFVRGQRARGSSALALRAKLKKRGVAPHLIDQALEDVAENETLDEDHAARTYAQKRRLAQRYDLDDPLQRRKALASLARRGFSFDVAARALSSEHPED